MTAEQPSPDKSDEAAPETTEVRLDYAGVSQVTSTEDATQVALFANLNRNPVKFDGHIKDPLRFREAMSALFSVVSSDYRYVPKDRAAYAAYMRMRRGSSATNSVMPKGVEHWQAQQAYYSWLLRNDPAAFFILDPIITVHPDQVLFEVFGKDEGTYAALGFRLGAFAVEPGHRYGTTNIDFSQALYDGLQQMRGYRQTRLDVGREEVKVATTVAGEVLQKQIRVPDSWLRGFLQVQSAATLPRDNFRLAPMDLYNLSRHLRLHADQKGRRRGLRIELVPGEYPRLILEPWEEVLTTNVATFQGKAARVVRVWGRRRLMLLRRLLPYVEGVDVHVLGSGLPSFWVLRGSDMTMTLGLTGFTASNWSQALNFDLLLPRKTQTSKPLESILTRLGTTWFASTKDLAKVIGLKGAALLEAVQLGCQQGKLMYDLAEDVYRLRPLTDAPLDLAKLEYRNRRERVAHDLLVRRGAVKIVSEHRIAGTGLELTGKVAVAEDKREYRPQLLLAEEGQVTKAECTCAFFRKQGLKAGPCAHLIALRLAYAEQEMKRLESGDPRQTVTMETRTYSKRDPKGEDVVQVSLQKRRLKVRWGRGGQSMRSQVLSFNTPDEARTAYFARIDELDAKGFLDATAG